jgi:hypothetical protein
MKRTIAIFCLTFAFSFAASAQIQNLLLIENLKMTMERDFSPRKKTDAHWYRAALIKDQKIEISLASNTVFLSDENECGVIFEMFDPAGKKMDLDEYQTTEDYFGEGFVERSGNYKLKIFTSCPEAFTTADLQRKKPKFDYTLNISLR